jgi:hypothetical protein
MQNKHQEHFEDFILTGDVRALNAILGTYHLSTKIDGSPSIIFGTDPSNGQFFCGTKSVLNKVKKKICYSVEDIYRLYDVNTQASLIEVLTACFKYLPRISGIYQGDFIGFQGSDEYKPNTITYKFPEVVSQKMVIAVHTQWETKGELKDAYVVGPAPQFESDDLVLFVNTEARQVAESDDFSEVVGFIQQMATIVTFATDKEAQEIKKQINACIRENREINPDDFDNPAVISLWKLVESVKLDFLHFCRAANAPDAYIDGERINQEGFVLQTDELIAKFVDRRSFSYHNFNSGRFQVV